MENHFRVTQGKLRARASSTLKNKLYPRKRPQHEQMAMASFSRASNWSKEKLLDDETLNVLNDGIVPLQHPDNLKYRVRTESSPSRKTDIYLRSYMPAGQRAESVCQDFRKGHLGSTPYFPKNEFVGKSRIIEKELGPAMRYGIRTENERLANLLDGTIRYIDPAGADETYMLFHPTWKHVKKNKWITPKNFDLTTCYYRGKKCREPWSIVTGGINNGDSYTEGFEVVGDLSRTRKRALEISPKNFLTTVVPNTSSKARLPPMDSTSVRTNKAGKFFFKDDTNKKTYPKTLKHIMSNTDEFEDQNAPSSPSARPKIIQIRSGTLDPLKESILSPAMNRLKSELTPHTEKSSLRPGFSATKRLKKVIIANRSDYIKETVETYFDR